MATTASPKMSAHSLKPRLEVRIKHCAGSARSSAARPLPAAPQRSPCASQRDHRIAIVSDPSAAMVVTSQTCLTRRQRCSKLPPLPRTSPWGVNCAAQSSDETPCLTRPLARICSTVFIFLSRTCLYRPRKWERSPAVAPWWHRGSHRASQVVLAIHSRALTFNLASALRVVSVGSVRLRMISEIPAPTKGK